MKFIKLEILNLASLDRPGGEVVNFEEGAIGESNIFSIVGPTGSGKSTILDAICLALYNRAPRYPRKKGEKKNIEIFGEPEGDEKNRLAPTDSRNILTRGKNEGYSKLTFLANNGNLYRAEWYIRKKTKNYDNAMTSLYRITLKNGVPTEETDDWENLIHIIGLDYDQFLRTVLIAQGSFANFLKAKEEERYELLEKLIGCKELYTSIAAKIKAQKDQAVDAYNKIAAQFSAQEQNILSEEDQIKLQARVAEQQAQEKQDKEELQKVTEAMSWYLQDEKHKANLNAYEQAFNHAKDQWEAFREQNKRLSLHDATIEAVTLYKDMKTAEENVDKLNKDLQNYAKAIATKEQEIKQEEVNLTKLQREAQQAIASLEQQKPHINKARQIKVELDNLKNTLTDKFAAKTEAEIARKKADKDVTDNAEQIQKDTATLQEAQQQLTSLQEKIQEEIKKLQHTAQDKADAFAKENGILETYDAAKLQDAKAQADKKQTELTNAIRIQKSLQEKQSTKLVNLEQQRTLTDRNGEIAEHLSTFNIDELTNELKTLRQTFTLMTSEKWEQHRTQLIEGQACPLCGATHHPYHEHTNVAPVVDNMNNLILKKQDILKQQKEASDKLTKEQSKNSGLLFGIQTTIATLEREIAYLHTEWADIQAIHKDWPTDVMALNAMKPSIDKNVEEAKQNLQVYNTLVKQVDELRKAKETAEQKLQTYEKQATEKKQDAEKKVTNANTVLATEKGKTENLRTQQVEKVHALKNITDQCEIATQEVTRKTEALNQEIGGNDPDTVEKTLEDAKVNADKAVKEKEHYIARLREHLKESKGQDIATKQLKVNEAKNITAKQSELAEWLSSHNQKFGNQPFTLSVIDEFYHATDNWEDIRTEQKRLTGNYTSAETTFKNEVKSHSEHQAKKPAQTKEELVSRKAELENRTYSELVNDKALLQRHETAKQQMGALFDDKQSTETLKNEWEQITDAIGSEGKTLRKIAQCYTLSFLIAHANVEIRKFSSRYELQHVKNSLGIRVIDHDRADDVREVTSLSGGETFIVSLGLALGLSALSSRNISFENLFIDEGFGTLDPDTLATVIDSLAMLQTSQGKKVGVISHTDTMSERITTQIRIIKNGSSGSSHIEIYP